ncbi:unnamed protein product (macronuclear) [Paramecium tetraurelia]|uniref:Uncharacterized protein n=1 Tax=Paramecium tetraurelia TaxID=5888 RepID=A0E9U4_PARTE|nr:uncharacterized protein GSPATT00024792001 [Paramecium tetraurelia]CAK92061.1 unnamed protein product [Paramecium tetraurelia]|eukprot:XP_001459458.1 hypothetical protein (macronuclear) [Paramecium tetraurelia strain d4-2]
MRIVVERYSFLSDSLPITAEQIVILQNYSKSLASKAKMEPITQLLKGMIQVENYTVDKRSSIHLFALCTIIFGVIPVLMYQSLQEKS